MKIFENDNIKKLETKNFDITIFKEYTDLRGRKHSKGISWPSYGSVRISEAKEFAELLQEAIKQSEHL